MPWLFIVDKSAPEAIDPFVSLVNLGHSCRDSVVGGDGFTEHLAYILFDIGLFSFSGTPATISSSETYTFLCRHMKLAA